MQLEAAVRLRAGRTKAIVFWKLLADARNDSGASRSKSTAASVKNLLSSGLAWKEMKGDIVLFYPGEQSWALTPQVIQASGVSESELRDWLKATVPPKGKESKFKTQTTIWD